MDPVGLQLARTLNNRPMLLHSSILIHPLTEAVPHGLRWSHAPGIAVATG